MNVIINHTIEIKYNMFWDCKVAIHAGTFVSMLGVAPEGSKGYVLISYEDEQYKIGIDTFNFLIGK